MSTTAIVILVAVAIAAALVITQRKKKGKTNSKPAPGPWVPPVLLDRNRKSPGDPGYDPRAVRPDPEFSPIEPQGTFWGEGPFDPNNRWIDINGRMHNP